MRHENQNYHATDNSNQEFNDEYSTNNDYYTDSNQSHQYDQYNQYDQTQMLDDPSTYQDFLSLASTNHPPNQFSEINQPLDPILEIQRQVQSLNLEDYHPDLNFPEQSSM
ncbi:hypothetical protein JTB14_017708 [Gonioctena quinquepunctata]|nr:hypothetical protein JTB14_017708 [Gonioctena quinquepunctata]